MTVRWRRAAVYLALLLGLVGWLALPVSANGPVPVPWFVVTVSNPPEEAVYADLLIPLKESDPNYSPLERGNLPEGIPEDAEIVAYCEDGYRSYTFHYREAGSHIALQGSPVFDRYVNFFVRETEEILREHLEDVEERGLVKLALLDERGNILQVSPAQWIRPASILQYSLNCMTYDAGAGTLTLDTAGSGIGYLAYLVLSLLGIIVTVALERAVGAGFGLGEKNLRVVTGTNVLSQIFMRVAFFPLYRVLRRYIPVMALLEILVYVGEYLIYCWKMKDISKMRCLAYTLTANTASLAVGLLLNQAMMLG